MLFGQTYQFFDGRHLRSGALHKVRRIILEIDEEIEKEAEIDHHPENILHKLHTTLWEHELRRSVNHSNYNLKLIETLFSAQSDLVHTVAQRMDHLVFNATDPFAIDLRAKGASAVQHIKLFPFPLNGTMVP